VNAPAGPSCRDCRYFQPVENIGLDGECRRHAPAALIYQDAPVGVWPRVSTVNWCGEFMRSGETALPQTIADIVRDNIHLCGHGFIGSTCGLCMRASGR